MKDDEVFVAGRSRETARALLDAAEAVGAEAGVVRTQQDGYIVPEEVAAKYSGEEPGEPAKAESKPKSKPRRPRAQKEN